MCAVGSSTRGPDQRLHHRQRLGALVAGSLRVAAASSDDATPSDVRHDAVDRADIEIHARETLALRAQLDELYATHTGQTAERIHSDSDRDRFMTPSEAIEYGLVDRVVSARR